MVLETRVVHNLCGKHMPLRYTVRTYIDIDIDEERANTTLN